jgi:ribosomal protein L11 methylase PrmA
MNSNVFGSFRDPSGFIFTHNGILFRQVNQRYQEEYDFLICSGLYDELVGTELLVAHEETDRKNAVTDEAYKVIKPQLVPFISYPYEWSFSQLKDAALVTLEIQRRALLKNMSLKDASAYNVQFFKGIPVFIDTLSFEKYREGFPWVAYRQFCQHFLAPLALISRTNVRLNQLLRIFIDGVPLELASLLLPASSKWSFSLGLHICLHARSQRRYADRVIRKEDIKRKFSRKSFLALLESLHSAVIKLKWQPSGTEWNDYYEANNNYGEEGLKDKERIVTEFLSEIAPKTVWDLGANTGRFSRIAAARGASVVAWDMDPACVESNYRMVRLQKEKNILPLNMDLTNPSPSIGWDNEERLSFAQRGPADTILALGLIHHLAIANNVPLEKIALFFSKICHSIIIEFIPKTDSQVQKLLSSRENIFSEYNQLTFERVFRKYFTILRMVNIRGTQRYLYLMVRIKA